MTLDGTPLGNLLLALPGLHRHHAPGSPTYAFLRHAARREVEALFAGEGTEARSLPPFGDLVFPYHRMGAVDSLNLFDLDELILFSFYWANRDRYRNALDVGANIGLHSILMSRAGFQVVAFEPDPVHFGLLERNLALNGCEGAELHNAAVSATSGVREFVRVRGNTTGSHLAGSKPNPYGELDHFPVSVEALGPYLARADLVKLDVEGQERDVLLATEPAQWETTDALVEVGSQENAEAIFHHFEGTPVRLFAQKIRWGRVGAVEEMPTSHREGTLFITRKSAMPWPGTEE